MPIAAAIVRDGDDMTASRTSIPVTSESRRTATFNGGENLQMHPRQPGPMFRNEVLTCRANYIRHLNGWLCHD
jgi:hypothetical protein